MVVISAQDLKYKYPQTTELALNSLSFEINQGEFIGIVGESHSGKSTICQSLLGLVPQFYKGAYGGRLEVLGMDTAHTPVHELSKSIGLVFQNPFTQMTGAKATVYEEIAFGLEQIGISQPNMKVQIDSVMKTLGIEALKDKDMLSLSGGQMQRVAIAGVLAMGPEILVMDEPTSQLDPEGAEEVMQAAKALSELGKTVIVVSHDMSQLARFCHRLMVLKEGALLCMDTPQAVFDRADFETFGIDCPPSVKLAKEMGLRDANNELPLSPEAFKKAWKEGVGCGENRA